MESVAVPTPSTEGELSEKTTDHGLIGAVKITPHTTEAITAFMRMQRGELRINPNHLAFAQDSNGEIVLGVDPDAMDERIAHERSGIPARVLREFSRTVAS